MKNNLWSFAAPLFFVILGILMTVNHDEIKQTAETVKPAVKTHTVIIEAMKFKPAHLTIHKGDIVVWINKGLVQHNVTDFPSKSWTSGMIQVGEKWEMTPDKSFNYYCSIHPTMLGSITVEE